MTMTSAASDFATDLTAAFYAYLADRPVSAADVEAGVTSADGDAIRRAITDWLNNGTPGTGQRILAAMTTEALPPGEADAQPRPGTDPGVTTTPTTEGYPLLTETRGP